MNYNYKRIFTFGCSFTSYIWPTWADIVSKSFTSATFYNLGLSGAGNLCIASRVAEANARYKFDENDLVMVMFTSFTREDRWVESRWQTYGNVYNNHFYDKDFCIKYADNFGYAVRDLSLIELTMSYLKNLKCTSYLMPSVPINNFITNYDQNNIPENIQNLLDVYKNLYNSMPISLLNDPNQNTEYVTYYSDLSGDKHVDSHPTPNYYYNYINEYIFPLTLESKHYALRSTEELLGFKTRLDIVNRWNKEFELHRRIRMF